MKGRRETESDLLFQQDISLDINPTPPPRVERHEESPKSN